MKIRIRTDTDDRDEVILIDLDSDLQRKTFGFMLECGIKEIAGPGADLDAVLGQMRVWEYETQRGKD